MGNTRLFELPRYDLTVFGADPSSGVMTEQTAGHVDFFKEGGTCRSSSSIADGVTGAISMYDTGALAVGDFVFRETDTAQMVEVKSILFGAITIENLTGAPFAWSLGDRLIPNTNRPTMYADERGRGVGFQQLGLAAGGVAAYGFNFDALLYDGAGAVQRVLKEQTPIGGEDEIDVRKFGALCDGVTDDTEAINAALAYVAVQAFNSGPRVLRLHGAPMVSQKLVIDGTAVILRGDGQTATYLTQMGTETLLEISAVDVVVEGMSLQRSVVGGIADRPLDVLSSAAGFRGRHLRIVTPGSGIAVRSDGSIFDNIRMFSGAGWARGFTIIGTAAQRFGTTIRGLHADMAGDGTQFGIMVEAGAKHFRLSQSVLVSIDPGAQNYVGMQFQLGGGDPIEDAVITDTFLSAGEGSIAVNLHAGRGIHFKGVTIADSKIGYRTATVGGKECEEVSWANCGCVGMEEASWVFDDGDAVKRVNACWSSDVSQSGDGVHPHMSINANNVYVDGFAFGNHIRETAIEASHGIKYETAGPYSQGHVHGAVNVNTAINNGITAGGNAIHAPEDKVLASIDISHNVHAKNTGTANNGIVRDHPASANARLETGPLVGDTTMDLNAAVIEIVGPGRTFVDYIVPLGNDGHEIKIINQTANGFILNHVAGKFVTIGAAPKVLATAEFFRVMRIGDIYYQMDIPRAMA